MTSSLRACTSASAQWRSRSHSIRIARGAFACAIAALACCGSLAHAQTSASWLPTAAGTYTWGTGTNWSGGVAASGAGSVASFVVDAAASTFPAAAQTINLNGTVTTGTIRWEDTSGGTVVPYNIAPGTSGTLNLATVAGSTPTISFVGSSGNQNLVISAPISGTQGLQVGGLGTNTAQVWLTGVNTFTGNLTVDARPALFFNLEGNGRLGGGDFAGNVSLGTGATARMNMAGLQILSGSLSGAGTVEMWGATPLVAATTGTLALNGANTGFTGTVNLNRTPGTASEGRVLQLGNADALRNATLRTSTSALANAGTRTVQFASGIGTFNLGGLNAGDNGTGNIVLSDTSNNAITLAVGWNNAASAFSGTFSGAGSLTKVGSGTLTLSAANTYTGGSTISAGRLAVGNAAALGASTGPLAVNAGTLDLGGFSVNVGVLSGSAGAVITTSTAAGTATLTTNAASNSTFAGTIQDNGSGVVALTKTGAGQLTLTGVNTYSGTTTISGGVLIASSSSALPGFASSGRVVFGGGILQLPVDGTLWTMGQVGTIFANATKTSGQLAIDVASGNQSQTGAAYSGSIGLRKLGSGTLSLTAANTYTGTTTVDNGTLFFGNTGASIRGPLTINAGGTASLGQWSLGFVGSNPVTSIAIDGGVLDVRNVGGFVTLGAPNTVTMAGGTISGPAPAMLYASAGAYNPVFTIVASPTTATISSGLELRMNSNANIVTFDVGAGTTPSGVDLLVSGPIISSTLTQTGGGLTKSGAGLMRLTAANTYTGATTVNAGILEIGGGSTTGSLSGSTAITGSAGGTLAFNRSDNYGGAFGNAISGGLGILLRGGTLSLSATNTFTGATAINAGILSIPTADALQGTSGVTINGGAGLTYTGGAATLAKNLTVTAGSGTGTIRNTGGGLLTLSGNLSKDNSVLRLTGGAFNVTGTISGATPNASDLLVDGTSTVTLSSANTYNGPTFVNQASTLIVGINNAIPSNSTVTLGNATSTGTLDLGTFTNQIGGLVFSGSGGTVRMAANQTASPQLSTSSALTLGSNASLDLAGMQTAAGNYRLISSTGLSGTFGSVTGLNSNYVLRYGTVNANEISAQRKAQFGTVAATPAAVSIITGGSTAFSYTVVNATPTNGSTLSFSSATGANVAGASNGTAIAGGTSASIAGLVFTGTSVGLNQTGSFTLTDPDAIGTTANGSVSVNVLNHSLASFAATDTATKTLDFGTYDAGSWSGGDGGNGTLAYSIFNIASLGFSDAETAGLNFYDWEFASGNDVFSVGFSSFANLAAGGSNGLFATVLSPGGLAEGSYTGTYTLKFRDQQDLSGAINTRDLTLTMNVVVVPEPGAIALAAIGIAAAAWARRRRRASAQ